MAKGSLQPQASIAEQNPEVNTLQAPSEFDHIMDPYTRAVWEHHVDSAVLKKVYLHWYENGGRQLERAHFDLIKQEVGEEELSEFFNFREVLYEAFRLEFEWDEVDLLQKCKTVITKQGVFDIEAYLEFHRVINGADSEIIRICDLFRIQRAAARQLKHESFLRLLLDAMEVPTVGFT